MRTAVLINYSANNHSGKRKWLRIQDKMMRYLPANTIILPYTTPFDMKPCLTTLIHEEDVKYLVSAGGDGSMNHILNSLLEITGNNSSEFCLGGIGLGSSNDFLKPATRRINDVPVKILPDFNNFADIGKVIFRDEHGKKIARLFINNASLGVTADANLLFNRGDFIIRRLKSRMVGLTILYTALKTLITYKNKDLKITANGSCKSIRAANISLTKNPYISGSFHYDTCPPRDGGDLGFHCSEDMSRLEIIKTMWDLSQGIFSGSPKRKTTFVKKINISSDQVIALETDGEILMGSDFTFTTIPKAICLAS